MKYIVLQTAEGEKLPIIFPERLVHADVAKVMAQMISFRDAGQLGKQRPVVASAGFVGMADVTVSGESESLGSIRHNPLDALRIMAGASVAHMPDSIIQPVADKLNAVPDPKDDELKCLRAALTEIAGCFDAAEAEGISDVLGQQEECAPGSLYDLVLRRLGPAGQIAREALK